MRIHVERAPFAQEGRDMARVAVVFPAYNEEAHVAEAVAAALAAGVGKVVVVNDCSTDGTAAVIDGLSASDARVSAVHHDVNMGKQAAVKTGLARALEQPVCEAFSVLDSDMQNDPSLLPGMCPLIGPYDMVIGCRDRSEMPAVRQLANTASNLPYRLLAAMRITDVQSGYRIYSRETAQCLAERLAVHGRYTFEHTSLLLIGKDFAARGRDLRIAEVTIPCPYGDSASNIRARDKLQLTWASFADAIRLARLQRG